MEYFVKKYQEINKYDELIGQSFKVIEPGVIRYYLEIGTKHVSNLNVSHGGVLAGMMDAALGVAALTLAFSEKKLSSTVEFKINYVRPAIVGDKLVAKSQVDSSGKSLVVSSCKIFNEETDELICMGMGTFNLYPLEKSEMAQELIKKGDYVK